MINFCLNFSKKVQFDSVRRSSRLKGFYYYIRGNLSNLIQISKRSLKINKIVKIEPI